ncbi:PRC-barrel domain-containing protein [Pedobacter aquatilis]|uniref:PRC-barrel domain-containing protein n=1 Tax=Pedobacter aquatilis TaxID=351343 RepID=UPI00292FB8FF|nr:PRC-barrel domain-containing protein [Pedobacter aquatilis]
MNTGNIEYVNLEELSNSNYVINDGQANIIGWHAKSEDGTALGVVRDLLIDPAENTVRYVVIDLDAALLIDDEKAVLIPIGYINLADDSKEIIVPVSHESQLMALPQYIIGELTRDTEQQIRIALGSPAASRLEETEIDQQAISFYQHHHFDRGNIIGSSNDQGNKLTTSQPSQAREEEQEKIHELIARAQVGHEGNHLGDHQVENPNEFTVHTTNGPLRIESQENGTYRVFNHDEKVGLIYAQAGDEAARWGTMDDLPESLVNEIGEAITIHNSKQSKE